MLRFLSKREEQVVRMRFGIGTRIHSTAEISQRLGITPLQVRRLQLRAFGKLRETRVLVDTPDGAVPCSARSGDRPPWWTEDLRGLRDDMGREANPWDEV
jgi:hypothetical protein